MAARKIDRRVAAELPHLNDREDPWPGTWSGVPVDLWHVKNAQHVVEEPSSPADSGEDHLQHDRDDDRRNEVRKEDR